MPDAAARTDLLDRAHLAAIFAGLDGAVVLAVSGGSDSMALLRLAAHWAAGSDRPVFHVATVDHGLRREAADEAAFVAAAAAERGLPHTTLHWTGAKPTTRVQERARAARYALLAAHARTLGATCIVTAHHADDQAETILMRLGRGSGLDGLAGMRRDTRLAPGLTLVRPVLDVPKSDLVALCRRLGQSYVNDPSNDDSRFARPRLRAQADVAASLGLDRSTLLRLGRRMARAEAALEAEARRLEGRLAPRRAPGLWVASLAESAASPELLTRVLRAAVAEVGGRRVIRLERLEALADALHDALAARRSLRTTLGGAQIDLARDATISVTPERPRRRGHRAPYTTLGAGLHAEPPR